MTLPVGEETLSRERIAAQAERMNLTVTSDEQFAFLQARDSVQLQAAPGSGKTTLVALKLAVLTQEWPSAGHGICVLSHTNIATEEITSRLSDTTGTRLLRHPHFIGTIQNFTHTFLALPALHAAGIAPRAIDDDVYATHAARLLLAPDFRKLRGFVRRRSNGMDIVTQAGYVFEPDEPNLHIPVPRRTFGRHTRCYDELRRLKGRLARAGVYRYQDMYAIAEQHLHRHPELRTGLRHRFPFVCIDEMQDTDAGQLALLEAVFDEAVTIQTVGDVNQRIYHHDDPGPAREGLPGRRVLELSTSQRFGPDIAKIASRLTINRPQTIHGNGPQGTLAVITFTEQTIGDVATTFERLVQANISPEAVAAHPPKILGGRAKPGDSNLFPRAISSYLPHHTAPPQAADSGNVILDAYRIGIAAIERDELLRPALARLWDAVRDLVWHYQCKAQPGTIPTRLPALRDLDRHVDSTGHRIRALLVQALTNDHDNPEAWQRFTFTLLDAVGEITDYRASEDRYLRGLASSHTPRPAAIERARTYSAGTTAAAKGETHCATLVLECVTAKGNAHDLGPLLSVISGAKPATKIRRSHRHAALTTFVAATRARQLLALAIHLERLEPHRRQLMRDGWLVVEAGTATTRTSAMDRSNAGASSIAEPLPFLWSE